MQSRRAFFTVVLQVLGASLASGTVLAAPATRSSAPPRKATSPEPARSELALFADLPSMGGCRVVSVSPVLAGAVPLVLEGPSGRFQVDACRAAPGRAKGMARGRSLEFFVHNGGRGDRQSSAEQILAVRALATELDRREAAGVEMPLLLSWVERQELAARDNLILDALPTLQARHA